MKPHNVLLCCALSAMAGALLCYAVLRSPHADAGRAVAAGAPSIDEVAQLDAATPGSAPDTTRSAGNATGVVSRTRAAAAPADSTGSLAGHTRTNAATRASRAGPMPMTDENLRRAGNVISELRLHNSDMDDLYMLLDHEGRDAAWSEAAEAQLTAFLRTYGAGYDGLEVKPPRCSASACEMVAVAQPGLDTQAAHANWQRLLGVMYGQDWFRNTFVDQRMAMMIKDGSAIYVTNFMRADPAR